MGKGRERRKRNKRKSDKRKNGEAPKSEPLDWYQQYLLRRVSK